MPPVGQKLIPPKGPASAFNAGIPPLVAAGKNLKLSRPRSSPAMMFDALATPGRKGMPLARSEEHTSELQSLMRISYAVFCLKKKNNTQQVKNLQHDIFMATH